LEKVEDSVKVFERIAKKGPSLDLENFDSHDAYEESIQSRTHCLD
jgi:hypothetical protein